MTYRQQKAKRHEHQDIKNNVTPHDGWKVHPRFPVWIEKRHDFSAFIKACSHHKSYAQNHYDIAYENRPEQDFSYRYIALFKEKSVNYNRTYSYECGEDNAEEKISRAEGN